ncbi:Probable RNA-directed DNA polymerase from transposon BS [Eumeta japonica]|uniref:Probable RNA-directed DNA polymerase from transposon BS n=1 Tax=Eumeta variegata TaxID=151549 RepID=A0A4C1XP81_EUMVA|nr:Probable RNA-directed DNA polymerase from transposon BS [Eumeta japonica]
MGPPDGGRPISTSKITDWKRESTAFEKIDTLPLNSIPDDMRTTEEIDHAIGALTSHVRTVVEKCERKVPASSDRRKFPPDILELIRAKNAALRRASAYPTPEYRSRARALQREVKAHVQEFRNESWSDLMEEIRPSHKAFWKINKVLKTGGYTPIPPLKRPDDTIALDDAEVAECLADSIETQCSHASPPHDPTHISRIEEEVLQKTSLQPKNDLTLVSLSEVQTLVKSISTRKAPGLDGISNKAIKCFSLPTLSLLVAIFNACLKNCYFPPAWKEAEVIGIHKPGKPRDLPPASYRPICLLSAHSYPQQVLRLVEYITEGFKTKQKTVAVFFDVAKAFDRTTNQRGVPQGSALSPLLYSAYTNDIPRPTSGVQLALFADDTALFYRNRYRDIIARHLQRAIDELGQWFRLWRIEVNPEKSAALQFLYSKHRTAADRSRPGRRNGNRPVTVSGDILCRDDTLQESSIGHVTRRRHSHVPFGRTRAMLWSTWLWHENKPTLLVRYHTFSERRHEVTAFAVSLCSESESSGGTLSLSSPQCLLYHPLPFHHPFPHPSHTLFLPKRISDSSQSIGDSSGVT